MAGQIDWGKIKKEYIKGGISQRDLAAKYGVSYSTLKNTSVREGWVRLREQVERRTDAKAVDQISDQRLADERKIHEAAMLLMEAYMASVRGLKDDCGIIVPSMLKDLGSTLKSIQSVLDSRPSQMDIEEQRARIEKLRRDCEDKKQEDIKIVFADDVQSMIGGLYGAGAGQTK